MTKLIIRSHTLLFSIFLILSCTDKENNELENASKLFNTKWAISSMEAIVETSNQTYCDESLIFSNKWFQFNSNGTTISGDGENQQTSTYNFDGTTISVEGEEFDVVIEKLNSDSLWFKSKTPVSTEFGKAYLLFKNKPFNQIDEISIDTSLLFHHKWKPYEVFYWVGDNSHKIDFSDSDQWCGFCHNQNYYEFIDGNIDSSRFVIRDKFFKVDGTIYSIEKLTNSELVVVQKNPDLSSGKKIEIHYSKWIN